MTSFWNKIKDREAVHAYVLGTKAYQDGLSMLSQYERGSKADADWLDGWLDAMFLRKI